MFHAEDLDPRALDRRLEALDPFVVDGGRDAAQHDDLAAFGHLLDEELARDPAKAGVVAGNIEVFDAFFRQAPVDHGDPGAAVGHALHRCGQRFAFERQHHQRVDVAGRDHVLDVVDLLGRVGGGGEHEVELGIGRFQPGDGLLGVEVEPAGPAVGRRRDRHADHGGVLGEGRSGQDERHRRGGKAVFQIHCVSSLVDRCLLSHRVDFLARCSTTARMMMTPWIAPLR